MKRIIILLIFLFITCSLNPQYLTYSVTGDSRNLTVTYYVNPDNSKSKYWVDLENPELPFEKEIEIKEDGNYCIRAEVQDFKNIEICINDHGKTEKFCISTTSWSNFVGVCKYFK